MSGGGSRTAILSPGKDLEQGAGETAPLSGNGNFPGHPHPHLSAMASELRVFVRGKPWPTRAAALNVLACLRLIAQGHGSPPTHAALAENVERLRGAE